LSMNSRVAMAMLAAAVLVSPSLAQMRGAGVSRGVVGGVPGRGFRVDFGHGRVRSEEHTSELQSRRDLVCRLLLEKKNPGDLQVGEYRRALSGIRRLALPGNMRRGMLEERPVQRHPVARLYRVYCAKYLVDCSLAF